MVGVALTLVATLVAIVVAAAVSIPKPTPTAHTGTTVTAVLADVRAGKIATATLDESAHQVTVTHRRTGDAASAGDRETVAAATVPDAYVRDLVSAFVTAGVPLAVTNPAGSLTAAAGTAVVGMVT